MFAKHYAKYNAGVMAVGGDQTAHLMWRLQHGEVPQKHKPKVAVLLIGTNDLGAAAWEATDVHTAEEATMRAVPGVTLRCCPWGVPRLAGWLHSWRLAPCLSHHATCLALPSRCAWLHGAPTLCPVPPAPWLRRVLKTLHTMKDLLPDTHVILLALLPRGGNGPGARFFHWPSVFTQVGRRRCQLAPLAPALLPVDQP